MWYNTSVSHILGIQYPILQGPFGGGLSSAKLASAVSNSGGLGGFGAYQFQPSGIIKIVEEIQTLTNKPFNINLWVNDVDEESNSYSIEAYDEVASVSNYSLMS